MVELAQLPEFKAMWDRRRRRLERLVADLVEARRRMREGTYRQASRAEPSGPALNAYDKLVSALLKDGKHIVVNDLCDILHASVSLAYAHWVVLDGAWANYGRQLRRDQHVRVFPVNKLDEALAVLEHLLVVPGEPPSS